MLTENIQQAYDRLMSGQAVSLPQGRVWDIMMHLDYYHINTLMIQSDSENTTRVTQWFVCKVDEPTVKMYLREKAQELRIV